MDHLDLDKQYHLNEYIQVLLVKTFNKQDQEYLQTKSKLNTETNIWLMLHQENERFLKTDSYIQAYKYFY
jgi:hypothetical protein